MKYWKELTIGVLIFIIIMLLQDCKGEEKVIITEKDKIVKIDEVVGDLVPKGTKELPSTGTDSIVYKDRVIYSTHPLDKEWAEKVKKAKDSIAKLNLLVEAIQIKEQNTDFSNKDLELKVWTQTRGELKDIKVNYKIPERDVIVKERTIEKFTEVKDNFGTLLGGGYNHSLDANTNSSFEVNAGIRIKKLIILGTANTEKQVGGKILIEL